VSPNAPSYVDDGELARNYASSPVFHSAAVSTPCACRVAEGKQIAVSLNTYIVCVALVMAKPSS
jgi:hypothetical protein